MTLKLVEPLTQVEGQEKVAEVDVKSLTAADKKLVKAVDTGHSAEAALAESMHVAIENSDFSSASLNIGKDGSSIKVTIVDDISAEDKDDDKDDAAKGSAVISEIVNGHMKAFVESTSAMIKEKSDAEDASEV